MKLGDDGRGPLAEGERGDAVGERDHWAELGRKVGRERGKEAGPLLHGSGTRREMVTWTGPKEKRKRER